MYDSCNRAALYILQMAAIEMSDESREQKWSNPETGCSLILESQYRMVWSCYCRCTGLPATGNSRTRQHYTNSAGIGKAIVKYQDPSSGTWYQVTDQEHVKVIIWNHLPLPCLSIRAKAINKGYIGNEYIEPTQKPLTEW